MRALLVAAVLSLSLLAFTNCGPAQSECSSGECSDAGLVINELAGSGGDFIEFFNASDTAYDLTGMGVTDADDAGVPRYATSLRFPSGTSVPARGYFTVSLETDCLATVTPCVRGEFGLSQNEGDTVTLLDATNHSVLQLSYPANAASSGSSWARVYDGASDFEVQRRSPGAKNAP